MTEQTEFVSDILNQPQEQAAFPAAGDFHLQIDDEGVAWLAIDINDSEKNMLRASFVDEFEQILQFLYQHEGIVGLIIYSAKVDNFVVGADISMLNACHSAKQAQALATHGQRLFQQIESLPFHVVAAIHGSCLGAGLELALACDSRIITDDEHTGLGLPEVKLGLLPGSGGTQRLPKLIGTKNALDLMLTGKTLSAVQAWELGLADEIVPTSILLATAKELAQTSVYPRDINIKNWLLTTNPLSRRLFFRLVRKKITAKTHGNYPAPDDIIDAVEQGIRLGAEAGFALEAERFGELVISPSSCALRHLFFISTDNKKPRTEFGKARALRDVSVIGAGLMGVGISYVSAINATRNVWIKDVSNEAIAKALHHCFCELKKNKRVLLNDAERKKKMSRLAGGTHYHGRHEQDLVIEAVFEDLALKQQTLNDVESLSHPHCIFASNTSSLSITALAGAAQRPHNVIGLHYFSPVEKMPLVEIIPHAGTAKQTIASVIEFAKQQGKMPIVVADKPGFYVNRILAVYLNEAASMLMDGEDITKMDAVLTDFGFPVGPFTLLDEIGIDICAKVSPALFEEYGERFDAPAIFSRMLESDRLGRKSGKGFYRYKNKKKQADKSLYSLLDVAKAQPLDEQEVALRCLLLLLNEAVRCLDEGVISHVKDGDIGAVFGLGFPPFLGGPFWYMDALGISKTVKLMQKYQQRYGERFAPCSLLVKMMHEQARFYPAST